MYQGVVADRLGITVFCIFHKIYDKVVQMSGNNRISRYGEDFLCHINGAHCKFLVKVYLY